MDGLLNDDIDAMDILQKLLENKLSHGIAQLQAATDKGIGDYVVLFCV